MSHKTSGFPFQHSNDGFQRLKILSVLFFRFICRPQFERAMLKERTKSGLDSTRKEGRIGGRRAKLTVQQQKEVVSLVTSGQKTGADAARLFRVHP